MGHARAAEFIHTGPLDPKRRSPIVVNDIVEESEVLNHALDIAEKLAAKPPQALRLSRVFYDVRQKKKCKRLWISR